MPRPDRRSPEAIIWRKWYFTSQWRALRQAQLDREPNCRMCAAKGVRTTANTADHIQAHKGSAALFWNPANLQSLCEPHHNGPKAHIERHGFSNEIGADGFPLDPKNPFNTGKPIKQWGFSIPHGVEPSGIPVILVCGPPASGKSTYVQAHKKPGDTVIDLDECKVRIGGRMWDNDPDIFRRAIAYRDAMIRELAIRTTGRAFLIVSAPTKAEHKEWKAALGNVTIVLIDTNEAECIARIKADPARAYVADTLSGAVHRWWTAHRLDLR